MKCGVERNIIWLAFIFLHLDVDCIPYIKFVFFARY